MARVNRRRAGLLLAAVVLLVGLFGVNALVAWFWPQHPGWVIGLIVFDFAAFVVIFIMFHAALDPSRQAAPPPGHFRRNSK